MTSFTRRLFVGAASLVLAASAFGQWRGDDWRYRDDYRRYRDNYYDRDERYYGRDRSLGLVDRVISHLEGAQGFGQSGGDRRHLDHARNDLFRFREKWYRGKFDRGRLDSAIDHIHHVVDSRWVGPRERSALSRDMYDLRDFRATGGGYGRRPY